MTLMAGPSQARFLLNQLQWFVGLRWAAGLSVLSFGLISDWINEGEDTTSVMITVLGACIVVYNVPFLLLLRQRPVLAIRPGLLSGMAWLQMGLDLAAISLLSAWTGGLDSPFIGFFVIHMVFASMLLRSVEAYASAALAFLLFFISLSITGDWPTDRNEAVRAVLWITALLLIVFVANQIVNQLRVKQSQLSRQYRHSLGMARALEQQQKALVQHEKMVALGQMAANIAHEIANPLASMDSMLQLMLRMPDRRDDKSLTILRDQIQRIHATIRQMTTFSRPDAVAGPPIPLQLVIDQGLQVLALDKRMRNVEIERSESGEQPGESQVPSSVEQVFVNLVVNALDAMREIDSPRLEIHLARVDGHGTRLTLTDNGHGIDKEVVEHIFEPFYTTKPPGSGTGLGLSISYRLVESFGGTIDVRSTIGKGTSFSILIPDGVTPSSRMIG